MKKYKTMILYHRNVRVSIQGYYLPDNLSITIDGQLSYNGDRKALNADAEIWTAEFEGKDAVGRHVEDVLPDGPDLSYGGNNSHK